MKTRVTFFLTLFIFTVSLLFCDEKTESKVAKNYPVLVQQPELSTFASLLDKAGLVEFFHGSGPFTFFAPSNDAFKKMDQALLERLQQPENKGDLIDLVNYHVLLGTYRTQNIKNGSYGTINGNPVTIRVENSKATVNDATIVSDAIEGPNGVGYVIDTVLIPPKN